MIEEYKSDSWRDFAQRYRETFGWFITESKSKVLVKLTEVQEDKLTFIDKSRVSYTANADKGNCFEFIPLEKSLYNYLGKVVLVERIPARQWRRGIHPHNTSVGFIHNTWPQQDISVNFALLEEVLKEDNHARGLGNYLTGITTEVALNPMFGVANNTLYVYSRAIGTIKDNIITLTSVLFKQEISDVIRDLSLPWKFV